MVFIESRAFTRRLHELAGPVADDVLRDIQNDLLANPSRGRIVRGLGGIRKERSMNPLRGRGKRGGLRYMYVYLEHQGHIHLLYILDKREQEDLTNAERAILRGMVARLKGI